MPLLNDPCGDLFRDFLPIGRSQRQLSFARVGEKTALDEHGGQPAIAQHVIFGRAHPTVLRADATNDLPLNARREHSAAIVFGIGLNTVRAPARRGIVMDANEDRIALRICDRASDRQGNKNVPGARHYGAQSRALQNFFQPQSRIERHHFFRHLLARNPSSIEAAVSWIDYNC